MGLLTTQYPVTLINNPFAELISAQKLKCPFEGNVIVTETANLVKFDAKITFDTRLIL